jgi:hypothetical protein
MYINPSGIVKVLEASGLREPEPPAPPQNILATVVKLPLNRHQLLCSIAGDLRVVMVKDNRNFRPGMSLPVVPDAEVFEYRGKMPRAKGRL